MGHPVTLSNTSKIKIEARAKFRRHAGPYDLAARSPRYGFEVLAADEAASHRVMDNSHSMGAPGRYFWVWDITNESSMPVFITLTRDGLPFDPRD